MLKNSEGMISVSGTYRKDRNKNIIAEKNISKPHKSTHEYKKIVTNFIQLVSPQPVDQFSQTKLHWKAPNEGYLHMCECTKATTND